MIRAFSKYLAKRIEYMVNNEAHITQGITQAPVETTKVTRKEPVSMGPKGGRPIFDWRTADKYMKLKSFRLEVNSIFQIIQCK